MTLVRPTRHVTAVSFYWTFAAIAMVSCSYDYDQFNPEDVPTVGGRATLDSSAVGGAGRSSSDPETGGGTRDATGGGSSPNFGGFETGGAPEVGAGGTQTPPVGGATNTSPPPAGGAGGVATTASTVSDCELPLSSCPPACVDLTSDAQNCGTCGHGCAVGTVCADGLCVCATAAACGNVNGATCEAQRCSCGSIVCPAAQICASKRACTAP